MAVMREVVNLGRNLREQHRIRVRQPLPGIKVATTQTLNASLRDALTDVVSEELNLKSVTWLDDPAQLVTVSAKANFKVLGRLLGPKMKPVANAISVLSAQEVQALMNGESLAIEGEDISLHTSFPAYSTSGRS